MRTDVKIGIILGLLVVAGIVVYFWFSPEDDRPDQPAADQTAKKAPGDAPIKLPAFESISRKPKEAETPGAPTDAAGTPRREPGSLLAKAPEAERPGSSGLRWPDLSDPSEPRTSAGPGETTATDTPAPSEPGDTPAVGRTAEREAGRDTLAIGPRSADTDTGRPLLGRGTPKAAETTPGALERREMPADAAGGTTEPGDVISVTGAPSERRDTVAIVPEPVTGTGGGTYRVLPGDKLWNIAEKRYGRGHLWTLISRANPGIDPSNLKVNTVLTIPPAPSPRATGPTATDVALLGPGYQTYTVQKGEGFWKIAAKFYGNGALWTVIAEANPKLSSTAIREGQKIIVPPKPAPRIRTGVTTEPVELRPGYRSYRVRAGDILSTVARRVYGDQKHWPLILDANPGLDPRRLKIGSTLAIPPLGSAPAVATTTRWTGVIEPEEPLRPLRTRPTPPSRDVIPPNRPDFGP